VRSWNRQWVQVDVKHRTITERIYARYSPSYMKDAANAVDF
jgi:hypothetical protein